ncbi:MULTISPECIES: FliH/SctL family protein [unclassified Sphingomonas]|jgi:flagellar biosynthesis/type III secretory pathway protein FliH|uniref:FliH/SctL family protein n=1 Tax=unclassified Sphingomonas TaxID=196159 RepID=UPI000832B221|nr:MULTISPECIES: hypothetical protein [unclassified Sphingomonas]
MSFYLIRANRDALLASDRPIVRAGDREPLADAVALFDMLERERHAGREAVATVEREAAARGFAAGEAAGMQRFADAVAAVAGEALRHREMLEHQVAELALTALHRMVDTLDDEAVIRGIARRAVADLVGAGPVTVEVSESVAPVVERALAEMDAGAIIVRGDPALDDTQCRVIVGDSRIIADRDVQIEAIRLRLEHADDA